MTHCLVSPITAEARYTEEGGGDPILLPRGISSSLQRRAAGIADARAEPQRELRPADGPFALGQQRDSLLDVEQTQHDPLHGPARAASPRDETDTRHETAEQPPAEERLTWRALLLACLLTFLCGFWVRQAEIVVVASQITESVPAIPAIAVLALLIILRPLVTRLGKRLALSSGETLLIYCFVAIAISMSGCGVIRFWIALVGYPFYYARYNPPLAALHQHIPGWLVPKDPDVILGLYEGAPDGRVPWGAWAVPLMVWGGFFLALWVGMLCMMVLVRRRWVEDERLVYPIVHLPLDLLGVQRLAPDQRPFLRNRVMWAGFGVAFVYNLVNILGALYPAVPTFGKSWDLNPYLTHWPWTRLMPLGLHFRPALVGFGFLMSTEMAFSIWFFFLVSKIEALLFVTRGVDIFGVPFEQEQSLGAFLLIGLWLLWLVRRQIGGAFLDLFKRHPEAEPDEAMPRRWALAGVLLSFVAVCAFCRIAGMALWVAVAYLGIVLLVALVCARIRAEAGMPLVWLFPYYQQSKVLTYTLGTNAFLSGTFPGTLTLLALLTFLSRGYFPSLIGYQAESLKIAREARIKPRHMGLVIVLALIVGLAVAYYFHLTAYYRHGGVYLRGGIWGTYQAWERYTAAAVAPTHATPPDTYRTAATIGGAALAGGLLVGRRLLIGFPFHPLGYAVGTAYGGLVWGPFFMVWLLKVIILKSGGMRLYRSAIPFFLGLALGHFFTAGVIWGLLGAYGGEAFWTYGVWFG
ncbi:MAG: hypothetical protein JSV65_07585 [Armatimonadota bacterium]|nr:MAG: hypothetical protein JSV65_07585 [Armatimonadota bacterium]